jgi:hypothetical protein
MGDDRIFAVYEGFSDGPSLPLLGRGLFDQQKASWPALAKAYAGLQGARRREVFQDGIPLVIQFNPGRIGSVEANIEKAALAGRPCFLCLDHLPPEQKAILYDDAFIILCNPFPIFAPHFTLAHCRHQPQSLDENIVPFLVLAREFSPDFSLFYNGPRCGASAPDHLHFQGYPTGALPVESVAIQQEGHLVVEIHSVMVRSLCLPGRHLLLLEGENLGALEKILGETLAVMRRLSGGQEEAMVNVVVSFSGRQWRIFIFPRRKHRPSAFFREGERRRAITPGAVEMGGVVITTNARDFTVLDQGQLLEIFAEVSVDADYLGSVVHELRTHLG